MTASEFRSFVLQKATDYAIENGRQKPTQEDIRRIKRFLSTGNPNISERARVIIIDKPHGMFPRPSRRGFGE